MESKIGFLLRNKYFFLLNLILFLVFWIWWLPGPRVANDFSFISNDWLKLQFNMPQAWNERGAEGLGEYGVFILWSYPISLFFGILANLGLNFEIWERMLILVFVFAGSFSIWKLLSLYKLSSQSKFIGSLFYLLNTYSLLLIDGGQISIAVSFALFPLGFFLVTNAIYSTARKKILAALFLGLLGFFDIRFLYILFLLILIKSLFDFFGSDKKSVTIRQYFTFGIICGLTLLGLNFYWLFAQIKYPLAQDIFNSFTQFSTKFVNIGHSILAIAPHWYKNIFGKISQLRVEFILLPILVFLAPIFKRKDKTVLFWLSIVIISTFLVKGGSQPLGDIYPWLHSNLPGFSFFRDSTKFFFLVFLSYSVLISITVEEVLKRIGGSRKIKVVFLLLISFYLLYLVRPVFLNQMTGTFSINPKQKDFQSLASILKGDKSFGRVFWIPTTYPLSYSDLDHPIVEAARVFNRIPFVYGVKGAYEVFNFLREAPYMGEIFDVAGISYIAYPYPDETRDDLHPDNIKYYYTFLNQLTSLPWIEKSISESRVPLLKTRAHQDKIFLTENSWFVFGTDEIFNEATKSAKLSLSHNAIIFAEQKIGLGPLIENSSETKIVLNGKTEIDLLATFISESDIIFPSKQLNTTPDHTGWWKNNGDNLIKWREFLQTKYNLDSKEFDLGGGWAVGEGNLELKIQDKGFNSEKVLLVRALESSRSGRIKIYQENNLIGLINTKTEDKRSLIRWFEVGSVQKEGGIVINTEGDINIINALALVKPEDLVIYKEKVKQAGRQISIFKNENVSSSSASVKYEKINQTKYKVTVSNITEPKLIIFSASFNPLWKINKQGATPVYGFLNGFRIEKDGEYEMSFEPQKNVEKGMMVTITTVILLISVPFALRYNK